MSMLSLRSKLHSASRQTRKQSTTTTTNIKSNPSNKGADASSGRSSSASSSLPPLAGSSSSAAVGGVAVAAATAGDGDWSSSAPHDNNNINSGISLSMSTLPAELLRKIACYCDVADILSLSRTGRHLRDILDDPFVFQKSLRLHVSLLVPAFLLS